MAKITIFGENGELKTITGTFSKLCEITSSYSDEQKFVDSMLNGKNIKYKYVYFEDSMMSSRVPIYAKDIKRVNQALRNQEFVKNHLWECPRVFSDFVRKYLKTSHTFYANTIYRSMINELDGLREKNIDQYYNFIIELMRKYNDYLDRKNNQQENNEYAMYVQAAYANLEKENEERFGKKEKEIVTEEEEYESEEFLEETELEETDESYLTTLYSFFRSDYVEDCDRLSTIIISNDYEAKKKLSNVLDKCNISYEKPFSKYSETDFIILIGNDIKNDIKSFINYEKPILAISLDKELRFDDDVVTLINGFDEEAIVNYLIKMQKKCKKVICHE